MNALLSKTVALRNEKIDVGVSSSDYMHKRQLAQYEYVLPLERGDGSKVMRGHYGNLNLELGAKGILDKDGIFESIETS